MFKMSHTSVKLSEHHLPHHFKLSSSRSPSQIFGKMYLSAEVFSQGAFFCTMVREIKSQMLISGAPTYSTFRHFSLISSAYLQHFPTLFSHFECLPTALFDTFQSIRAPTYSTFRHFSAISSTYIQHFSTHFSHFEHLPTALFDTFPQFSGISSHVGGDVLCLFHLYSHLYSQTKRQGLAPGDGGYKNTKSYNQIISYKTHNLIIHNMGEHQKQPVDQIQNHMNR